MILFMINGIYLISTGTLTFYVGNVFTGNGGLFLLLVLVTFLIALGYLFIAHRNLKQKVSMMIKEIEKQNSKIISLEEENVKLNQNNKDINKKLNEIENETKKWDDEKFTLSKEIESCKKQINKLLDAKRNNKNNDVTIEYYMDKKSDY